MSEDVGGTPFPDGDDHGGADDEFASVVFDEAFVRAASVHEPTAQERLLAAAQARAEAEAARARVVAADDDTDDDPHGYDDAYGPGRYGSADQAGAHQGDEDFDAFAAPHRHRRAYRGHTRWHRTVAWVLAVVMGLGVVALSFAAVYRGAAGGSREPAPPPATGRLDGTPHAPVRITTSVAP